MLMSNGPVDQTDYFAFKQHLLHTENEVCDNNTLFKPGDSTPASQAFQKTYCVHARLCTPACVFTHAQVSIDGCADNFITLR